MKFSILLNLVLSVALIGCTQSCEKTAEPRGNEKPRQTNRARPNHEVEKQEHDDRNRRLQQPAYAPVRNQ